MKKKLREEASVFWSKIFPNTAANSDKVIDFTAHFPMLKLAEQSRIFFSIFKFSSLELEYFSNNTFDVLGIEKEEFVEKNINIFFDKVASDHVNGFLESIKNARDYYNELKERGDFSANLTVRCGLKFEHSQKGIIKILWRSQIFEIADVADKPQWIMLMMQDVTHLMKDDFFWFRAAINDSKSPYYRTLRSDTEGLSHKDILSEREKEILKCFAEGKGTEDVAQELFISKITVNNHRQNMLNKLGARDITALIRLAKLTKII